MADEIAGGAAAPTSSSARPKRRRIWITVALITVLSVVGWFRLRIDSTLEPLLPQNSQARQTVLFLKDSSFASKAVLWFQLTGDGGSLADLIAAANAAEAKLDPTLIKRVIKPPGEASAMDEIFGLLDHAGELLNQSDLAAIQQVTEPAALKQRMRENYLQLTKPEGSFMQDIIRRDPLGVNSRVLGRLYSLTSGMGFRVEVKNGHFVHPDGRQLIVVLETSASATDVISSRALVAHLNAIAAAAPPGVKIIPIAGQMHTEQNDAMMRRDMNFAGTLDSIGFLVLFLLVCRDWRVAAVFMLPVVAIALAIGIAALIFHSVSAMVMGLSATMAGSAVDYGIFVYTAVWMGNHPREDLRRIRKHLLLSLLTTIGVFVAFMFSNIPAYRQLGWLTSICLVLAMAGALYVLPLIVRPGAKILSLGRGVPLLRWGKWMVPVVGVSALLLIGALFIARGEKYDPDLSRLDGVSPQVAQNEKDFQHTFSRNESDLAILVVTGHTLEEAEEANDKVAQLLSQHFQPGQLTTLSDFWPSAQTRKENFARWTAFWSPQRVADLRKNLAIAGEPYGFAADAFDPFFKNLTAAPRQSQSREVLSSIEEQFIARANGDYQMLSYFEDTEVHVTAVRKLLTDWPNAQVVSRRAMGQAFAESASAETKLLVGISVAFIVISLLAITHSVIKSILVMLPAAGGVVAMLATLSLLHLPLSVVSVIAAIMVMALCSDYGIFAVFAWHEDESIFGQGMTSMHLSSVTTLIGTGSLIFAHHPALFMVGVSMTSGLLVGYLTACFVIPGICYVLNIDKKRSAS